MTGAVSRRALLASAATTFGAGLALRPSGLAIARPFEPVPLDADRTRPLRLTDEPDAAILALWERRKVLAAALDEVCCGEPQDFGYGPAYAAWERASLAAGRRVTAVEELIAQTPAMGFTGLLVKARLMAEGLDGPEWGPYCLNGHALLSDLERLAGGAP